MYKTTALSVLKLGLRLRHSQCILDGKYYFYGGYSDHAHNELFVYDPAVDTLYQLANGPGARHGHSAIIVGGKMYIYGGILGDSSASSVNTAYMYDAAEGEWAPMTEGPSNKLCVYDPVTDTWNPLADGIIRSSEHSAIAIGDIICIVGTEDRSNNCLYNITSDVWGANPFV